MFRTITLLCTTALLFAAHITPAAAEQPEIMLTDDNTTAEADADKISSLIDTMANNVKACIKTHQAEGLECQCKFPDDLNRIKVAYDQALRLHPDWEDRIVSYKKGTEPTTSVSFSGLKEQFESCGDIDKTK